MQELILGEHRDWLDKKEYYHRYSSVRKVNKHRHAKFDKIDKFPKIIGKVTVILHYDD